MGKAIYWTSQYVNTMNMSCIGIGNIWLLLPVVYWFHILDKPVCKHIGYVVYWSQQYMTLCYQLYIGYIEPICYNISKRWHIGDANMQIDLEETYIGWRQYMANNKGREYIGWCCILGTSILDSFVTRILLAGYWKMVAYWL